MQEEKAVTQEELCRQSLFVPLYDFGTSKPMTFWPRSPVSNANQHKHVTLPILSRYK